MTQHQFRIIALATLSAVSISFATQANATDLEVIGSGRGSPFRAACANGFFMVGLKGRIGGWIDNFRVVCASFDMSTRKFVAARMIDPAAGLSQGGGSAEALCPGDEAVRKIDVFDTKGDGPTPVIHTIKFTCVLPTLNFPSEQIFGSSAPREGRPFGPFDVFTAFTGEFVQECPGNELVVGLAGRFGTFVDALGLICGAPPSAAPPPPPPPPPIVTQVPHPGDFTGKWQTRTNHITVAMTLVQNQRVVTGNYVTQLGDRGTINGRFGANILQFNWLQGQFKGTGEFTLAGDGNSFLGTYQAAPNPNLPPDFRAGPWVGTRE